MVKTRNTSSKARLTKEQKAALRRGEPVALGPHQLGFKPFTWSDVRPSTLLDSTLPKLVVSGNSNDKGLQDFSIEINFDPDLSYYGDHSDSLREPSQLIPTQMEVYGTYDNISFSEEGLEQLDNATDINTLSSEEREKLFESGKPVSTAEESGEIYPGEHLPFLSSPRALGKLRDSTEKAAFLGECPSPGPINFAMPKLQYPLTIETTLSSKGSPNFQSSVYVQAVVTSLQMDVLPELSVYQTHLFGDEVPVIRYTFSSPSNPLKASGEGFKNVALGTEKQPHKFQHLLYDAVTLERFDIEVSTTHEQPNLLEDYFHSEPWRSQDAWIAPTIKTTVTLKRSKSTGLNFTNIRQRTKEFVLFMDKVYDQQTIERIAEESGKPVAFDYTEDSFGLINNDPNTDFSDSNDGSIDSLTKKEEV